MPLRPFDSLVCIPSPDAIREKLAEPQTLAERLSMLLELAERLWLPLTTGAELPKTLAAPQAR